MSRRALITGAAGFVGRHLMRRLLDEGWEIVGATADAGDSGGIQPHDRLRWQTADIRRQEDVLELVANGPFDAVFHLAAVSFVPAAGNDPGEAVLVNVAATSRLLAALASHRDREGGNPRVLIVGSSEQYGRHEARDLPLREDAPQRPLSVYGATKVAQEVLALQCHRATGLEVICTRSFSHSGAGQDRRFLIAALVDRALALRQAPPPRRLALGNSTPVRDYLHVSDVLDAYLRLIDRGMPGEVYNVCSGEGVSVAELAAEVLARVGIEAEIYSDPQLVRPVEVPALVGDPTRLARATGWRITRSRADILDDLINAATH